MPETVENGTRREVAGKLCVFYDGYWIKWYDPPPESPVVKKQLIEALTRRLFNHVEHGINIPGIRLAEARKAYEEERDPERRRVNGAMLAGALFNRAADIFRSLVELQELGVKIDADNTLMRECSRCLLEALDFGKSVRHRGGDEGIDELWGEPFRAFSVPVEDFYKARYLKIAQAMRDIDRIADAMVTAFEGSRFFVGVDLAVPEFAGAAKLKCETLRTDPVIFDVWPSFVVAGERLSAAIPPATKTASGVERRGTADSMRLIEQGKDLITYTARARVSMPKSTQKFLARCARFRKRMIMEKQKALSRNR
jgi:hypothetical protein